jgi:hypothetical protein
MAFSQRTVPVLLVAAALVVGLAACSGNSVAGAGGGAGSGSGTKSGGGSGTTSSSSASFSGTESGTATVSTCTGSGMGIYVVVKGSSDKLPGAVSKSTMGFNGADSIYTLDKTGALPQFASDGNSVKLDGVKLKSVIDSSNEVTFSGTLTCP